MNRHGFVSQVFGMAVLLGLAIFSLNSSAVAADSAQLGAGARNAILFIGDGMGINQVHADALAQHGLHRDAAGNPPALEFEKFPVFGYCTTFSANSQVTDSGAAVTALACGQKTNNGMIGVTPEGAPLRNLSEIAHDSGRAVGVMSSVGINHATPAGFYAKVKSRGQYDDILDQFFKTSPVDVLLGGGFFGKRWDAAGIEKACAEQGIKLFTCANLKDFTPENAGNGRILGYFDTNNNKQLDMAATRKPDCSEPTLADLTVRMLSVLKRDPDGFFLMVEGGAIDWACHDNNSTNTLGEVREFERAIVQAMDYLKSQGLLENTLIVVTADHETGGLALTGSEEGGYSPDAKPGFGWVSKGHTAAPVGVWAAGPCAEKFAGKMDNTQIPARIAQALRAASPAPIRPGK